MPVRTTIPRAVGSYDIPPIETPIPAERQSAKRHYGVHPYFTRRPQNVVRDYIRHYSHSGDRVADPFGGSGVVAVEAFLENRCGIQNDINPFANFVATGIANLAKGNKVEYAEGLRKVEASCADRLHQIESLSSEEIQVRYRDVSLPPNVDLPRSSDVPHYHDLFTKRQLYALAILRQAIGTLRPDHVRGAMMLAWSATLPKLSRTFLSAEGRAESRGGSSIFSIYRYKVAARTVELPLWQTFRERAANVLAAKDEIDQTVELRRRTGGWNGSYQVLSLDVNDMARELKGTIDYVFTDPPYGGHIAYLDLSVLWNVWLELPVERYVRDRELIVGGDLDFSESWYVTKLGASIRACLEMLKPGRWMSVVFQHWNFRYFQAILDAAEEAGAELKAAVSQVGDPIWSMHKKKNRESVLAGELILTFYNRAKKRRKGRPFELEEVVHTYLSSAGDHIFGEQLLNHIVIEAWRSRSISALDVSKDEFTDLLRKEGWEYKDTTHQWHSANRRSSLF